MDEAAKGSNNTSLMAAVRSGDGAAQGELYLLYEARVRRLCARLTGDAWLAEDLTQETFLRAFRLISSFEKGREVWPWLATIARNVCFHRGRLAARERASVLDSDRGEQDPIHLVRSTGESDVDIRICVTAALAKLRPDERRLVWRHVIEGESYQALAHSEGTTVATVRNSTWRAQIRLRHMLADLRAAILVATAALARGARKTRMRIENLLARCPGCIDGLAVDGVLAAVLTLTVTFPSLEPSGPARAGTMRDRYQVAEKSWPERAPRSDDPSEQVPAAAALSAPIRSDVESEWVEDAAIPKRSYLRVEVTDLEGNVLLWQDVERSCQHREGELIPRQGPIRTMC